MPLHSLLARDTNTLWVIILFCGQLLITLYTLIHTYTHFLRGDANPLEWGYETYPTLWGIGGMGESLVELKDGWGCQKVGEDLLAAKGQIILRILLDYEMFTEAVNLVIIILTEKHVLSWGMAIVLICCAGKVLLL